MFLLYQTFRHCLIRCTKTPKVLKAEGCAWNECQSALVSKLQDWARDHQMILYISTLIMKGAAGGKTLSRWSDFGKMRRWCSLSILPVRNILHEICNSRGPYVVQWRRSKSASMCVLRLLPIESFNELSVILWKMPSTFFLWASSKIA